MQFNNTITLADGRKITNLALNGNNYISKTKVDESIFENNMSKITLTDGEQTTTIQNAYLVTQFEQEDGWHLVFAAKSQNELILEKMGAAIKNNTGDLTDLQLAFSELYALVAGGK